MNGVTCPPPGTGSDAACMRDLAILLVLVHAFVPETMTLVAGLPEAWRVASIAWHSLAG